MKLVRFSSHSQADILEVPSRGYWTHSANASKLEVGDTVVVTPNAALRKKGEQMCVVGKATSVSRLVPAQVWSSTNSNEHEYLYQIDLEYVCLIPYEGFPSWVTSPNNSMRGFRYIDLPEGGNNAKAL